MSVLLSLVASNVKGNTKRAIVNAMFFIGYCAGCIASPQLWTNRPKYLEGLITALVTWGLLIFTTVVYRLLCMRDNKGREREATSISGGSGLESAGVGHGQELDMNGSPYTDLTDKQDRAFRYSW